MMTHDTMHSQVALVTGGGGGIGSTICRRLAAAGARVVITYSRSLARAEATLGSLKGSGHRVIHAPVDDAEACNALASELDSVFGRLDLLVNNAGITTPVAHHDLDGLSDDWIDSIFRVNWRGAFATIRACLPLLKVPIESTVINLSSVAAKTGIGSNVAYCASKAAMDSMTRSLARALAPKIRVVSVSPGWVLGEYAKKMDPAYIESQTQATPLRRLASPDHVADAIWVVHTQLTNMTGNIIPVDGGRPLGVN